MSGIVSQGKLLEEFLLKNKINKKSLAEKLGISRTTLYQWFKMSVIPFENLEKIEIGLEMDISKIIKDKIENNEKNESYLYLKALNKKKAVNQLEVKVLLDGSKDNLEKAIEKLIELNNVLQN